jgi:hypothetical protein
MRAAAIGGAPISDDEPADREERLGLQGITPRPRFERLSGGRYRLEAAEEGTSFEVERLRRESGALVGELIVRCSVAGVTTHDGILTAGDLNLSSVRARQERGKYLADRARLEGVDFVGLVEELSQKIINAEREGAPLKFLRDLPRPALDDELVIDGLPLLRRHPLIMFGDGGAAKSYLALYLAGRMEELGLRTALYDWELAGEDHRDRLERLFGPEMPAVRYHRCASPLVHEADRIRRDVRTERLDFIILDSIAFACHDAPENAATAGAYFQALRSVGPVGSIHLAHVAKAEGSDQKPFGSSFWHNGARATWFVKRSEGNIEGTKVTIAAFNRKQNLGPVRSPIGWDIEFGKEATTFRRCDPADTPDLAEKMHLRHRISAALKSGSQTIADLADDLGAKQDSVKKALERGVGKDYVRMAGRDGVFRYGLVDRKAS